MSRTKHPSNREERLKIKKKKFYELKERKEILTKKRFQAILQDQETKNELQSTDHKGDPSIDG